MLWDQAQFRKGRKSSTQNSIQSSRTPGWKRSRKGDAGWSKTSYLPKQTEEACQKASSRARDKSSRKRKEKTSSQRQWASRREVGPGIPLELEQHQLGVRRPLLLWGLESLQVPAAAEPGPLASSFYLGLAGARGRSLRFVSGRAAPGSRGSMSAGREIPVLFLVTPTRLRTLG